MLGEPNTEQFEVATYLNGERVHHLKIHDPFVRTTTRIKGFGAAWKCLFLGLTVETRVNGTHGAMREVMMLDPMKMIEHDNADRRVPQIPVATTQVVDSGFQEKEKVG